MGKGKDEVGDDGGVGIEEVEVEVEGLTRGKGLGVEVEGAEDEGAGMVGETAGAGVHRRGGFEQAGVGASEAVFAGVGVGAMGEAGDAAEDGAECAAQDVGGFTGWEMDGLAGDEGEAKGFEVEEQEVILLSSVDCAGGRLNLKNLAASNNHCRENALQPHENVVTPSLFSIS